MLLLDQKVREELWQRAVVLIENYTNNVTQISVAPKVDPNIIRSMLKPVDFSKAMAPCEALEFAVYGLEHYQLHNAHPGYFGLFNPAPTTMGIVGEAVAAAFNPQLAVWAHSPFAVELEVHLIRAFCTKFGYSTDLCDGIFTSGGSEANHTALLTALTRRFPQFLDSGLNEATRRPVFYASSESHHSLLKAAKFCGLGGSAMRKIKVTPNFQMDFNHLRFMIDKDRREGVEPFLIVATAGSTNSGTVDQLAEIAKIAAREDLWFHVDAAWGGAAALVPELRPEFDGLELADSITFDPHKWLSIPSAAGMYLTRHPDILHRTCSIEADYIPKDSADSSIVNPFAHSMQWGRRFIGLKVFMSLAVAGWEGYENTIRSQVELGDFLRQELKKSGWKVVNATRLPVICFVDAEPPELETALYYRHIANEVIESGRAWISTTRLGTHQLVLRTCITNYRTEAKDIRALIQSLNHARSSVRQA